VCVFKGPEFCEVLINWSPRCSSMEDDGYWKQSRPDNLSSSSPVATTSSPTVSDKSVETFDGERTAARVHMMSRVDSSPNSHNNRPTSRYSHLSEEEKAQWLRDEISRESLSLQRLEKLAQDLPKLSNRRSMVVTKDQHIDNDYSYGDLHSTSRVIENLQNGMDALKRELREQKEIAKEERSSREAVKKRCEILESTMEVVKHQNDMLNRLLDRKERRIEELETTSAQKDEKISSLERSHVENASNRSGYEVEIKQLKAENERLDAAYNAVMESARRMKSKYHNDIVVIGEKIGHIQNERKSDSEKLASLESQLKEQVEQKTRLLAIQNNQQTLRQQQLERLEAIFAEINQNIKDSDSSVTTRIKSTLKVIDRLERHYIELGGDQRNINKPPDQITID
jgi:chromosome segregation ATPase